MSKVTNRVVLFLLGLVFGAVGGVCKTIAPIPTEFIEVPVEVPVPYEVVKTDTIVKELTEYVYNTDTIYKILTEFDTIKITEYVMAYFDTLYYSDTIKNEDLTAIVQDTVTQNRITSRQFKYQIKPYNQPKYFIGGEVSFPLDVALSGGYQSDKYIYKLSVSPKTITGGIYCKF